MMKKIAFQLILITMSCVCFAQNNPTTYMQKMNEIYSTYNLELTSKDQTQSRNEILRDSTLLFEDTQSNLVNKKTYAYNDDCVAFFEGTLFPDPTVITGYSFESSKWGLFYPDGALFSINCYDGNAFNNGTPTEKIEYTYNTDGTPDEYLISIYENGDWKNHRKREYFYDGFIFGDSYFDYAWDDANGSWINYQISVVEFTSNNIPLVTQVFVLNPDFTLIDRAQQYEYVFVDNTELIQEITMSVFSDSTNSWDPLFRSSYIYDNGNEVSFLFEIYDQDELEWNQFSRVDKTYIDNIYVEFEDTYSNQDGIWEFSKRSHHFYSDSACESVVAIEAVNKNEVQLIFANPMFDNTAITISGVTESTNISVYGFDGSRILTQAVDSDQTIYLPTNLPKGIYAINLLENNTVILTKKIVIP